MRAIPLVLAACLLSGCVPTADFTELRDDVRELQSDNKKLKQTEAELRKRLEAADRNQLPATTLKRLDAVEAALTDFKTRQQGIDQKLGAVITQLEENARQPESLSGRSEESVTKTPPKPARSIWPIMTTSKGITISRWPALKVFFVNFHPRVLPHMPSTGSENRTRINANTDLPSMPMSAWSPIIPRAIRFRRRSTRPAPATRNWAIWRRPEACSNGSLKNIRNRTKPRAPSRGLLSFDELKDRGPVARGREPNCSR